MNDFNEIYKVARDELRSYRDAIDYGKSLTGRIKLLEEKKLTIQSSLKERIQGNDGSDRISNILDEIEKLAKQLSDNAIFCECRANDIERKTSKLKPYYAVILRKRFIQLKTLKEIINEDDTRYMDTQALSKRLNKAIAHYSAIK